MTAEWAGQIRNYVSIRAPNVLRGAQTPRPDWVWIEI